MKQQVKWKPQEVGDTKDMDCLLMKVAGHEWSQPKEESMKAVICKVLKMWLWISYLTIT